MAGIIRRLTMGAEMNTLRARPILKNERGLAMLETVPLIVIFTVLVSFGLGFWGIVHTAVLHSIGARTYAYETFRQRTNLYYFRENGSGTTKPMNYKTKQWRYHAVNNENDDRERFVSTVRPIAFGRSTASEDASLETHNVQIFGIKSRNERIAVNPAWVMVGYGICLNSKCGGGE
jgi:hypothetical protein